MGSIHNQNLPTQNNLNSQQASSQQVSSHLQSNLRIKEHKITNQELEKLKSQEGIYQEGKSYSQTVGGHGTGLQPPTEAEWNTIAQTALVTDSVSYPNTASSVDNSRSPYFPPIGNQGGQGSCVAWSVGYYIATFEEAKANGWDLSGASWSNNQPTVSYQNKIMSPAFVYNLINWGEDFGTTFSTAVNLICNIGVSSWKNMPYNESDYSSWPTQAAWTEAPLYRGNTSSYQVLWFTDDAGINDLKNLLASGTLVSIDVDANKFSNLSSNDVWTIDNYDSPLPNHAGTVVGYDDNFSYVESGQTKYGAFKVANSWGISGWEPVQTGFYWISYAAMQQVVEDGFYYFPQTNYQPDLSATFNVDDALRSNCVLTVGLGNPSKLLITKCFTDYVYGGMRPFNVNNMVMDVTEFKAYMPSPYNQTFFLKAYDTNSQSNGTITYFAIGNSTATGTPAVMPTYPSSIFVNVPYSLMKPSVAISSTSGGPGYTTVLNGNAFTANNSVNIAYLNPVNSTWISISPVPTNSSYQFNCSLNIPDLMQSNPSGDNPAAYSNLIFQAQDNYYGYTCNTTIPYVEWQRGLTQLGSATAKGLFGNNTNFSSIMTLQANQSLPLLGCWFYPGTITLLLDNSVNVGNFPVSNVGFFNATLTIPSSTTEGQHNITITDRNTKFSLFITVTNPKPQPTPSPTPTLTPSPTTTPSASPSPSPTPTPPSPTPTTPSPTPPASTTPTPTPSPTPLPTPTATPTPTPTPSPTPKPTPSPTPTATPIETLAPTITPSPTESPPQTSPNPDTSTTSKSNSTQTTTNSPTAKATTSPSTLKGSIPEAPEFPSAVAAVLFTLATATTMAFYRKQRKNKT